jgi:hypothetical protein
MNDLVADFRAREDIQAVFIFYRGVLRLTGKDLDTLENGERYALFDKLQPFLQDIIDKLNALGIRAYIVSENPVLPYIPKDYITNIFSFNRFVIKPLPPTKAEVLAHQAEYLAMLKEIKGATIIYSIDTFCPEDRCLDFLPDGQVLYSDDDHLSKSGSVFQAEKLLAPYLEEIAAGLR